ncbi:S41 family peptidase [Muribaculum caecicola]|uniref:S41 family peptidase n=2 Tax=Muribaculum TaxID=1918540 RepID=A0AC61S7X6_9BACT|nr:S41 family peptidase [Muribaculum caecicola]THG54525.1 S41 family peptidase [Muribaculum caecicola]
MKSSKNLAAWLPLIIAVCMAAGIWIGLYVNRTYRLSDGEKKFSHVLELIKDEYVEDIDVDSLIEMTMPNLLTNLDPHTVYIPASELKEVNSDLDGSFSGIGISFTMFTDTITVNEVIPGGPSDKVGLLAGDRIVTINDSMVAGHNIPSTDIMKMLRGEKGTSVKLGIKRANAKKRLVFDVIRGDIPVNSVLASYMINDSIGYIKVSKFGRTTYNEFFTSLVQLAADGASGYIVDLRGNGGGIMEAAILMANEFLPVNAPIVYTRGRNQDDDSAVYADGNGSFSKASLSVLIDEYSASASEIFAGAMQDNDRALIIGRRSFGKGLVQRQTMLPDSSAIRITVSRYYTPSGRCIQKEYSKGKRNQYEHEILDRYDRGEFYDSDSIKLNLDLEYTTAGGRKVYGGGGIMPDVFVPNDTTGITSYYVNVFNAGLPQKYAFDYSDKNRDRLSKSTDVKSLLRQLPGDDEILQGFVSYAVANGVPARWYYINISSKIIVNYLKALIVNDILGSGYLYQVTNTQDNTVLKALDEMKKGNADAPIRSMENHKGKKAATVPSATDSKNVINEEGTDTVAN